MGWRGCQVYGAGSLGVGSICSESWPQGMSTPRGRSRQGRPSTPQNLPQGPQASPTPWADLNKTQRQSRAGTESQRSWFLPDPSPHRWDERNLEARAADTTQDHGIMEGVALLRGTQF